MPSSPSASNTFATGPRWQTDSTRSLTARAERTGCACRAGILEKYLTDPELLTNAQVEELIRMAFDHYDVQEAMNDMLQQAYEHPEAVIL